MIRTKLVLFSICGFLMWSCSSKEATESHLEETATHNEHHHDSDAASIELDNGNKWKVNEEMTPFILTGKDLVDSYITNQETDYTVLAANLQEQNKQLISSCTMDGKSHDELHKWLHPHLNYVKELANASNLDDANHIVEHLKYSYELYAQYFE